MTGCSMCVLRLLYRVIVSFASRGGYTICALVTGVQTCALPVFFLTVGRQEIGPFVPLAGERNGSRWFLTRLIDPPADDIALPAGELVLGRGPFAPDDEKALMQQHRIDLLVTKNAGGAAGKIAADRKSTRLNSSH